jgi:hypothetical protein
MKAFQAQNPTEQGQNNPFNERLKEFYFRIVQLALESENLMIVNMTENLIVDVCVA